MRVAAVKASTPGPAMLSNMFGDVARCSYGEHMKVYRRGDRGDCVYLGRSATYVGGCSNRRFFRVDQMERALLPAITDEVVPETPAVDPTESLDRQIAKAQADAVTY
jgi:hypothetical protein